MIYAVLTIIIVMLSLLCLSLTIVAAKYYKESKFKLIGEDITVIKYSYDNLQPITLEYSYLMDERFFRFYYDKNLMPHALDELKYMLFGKLIEPLRDDFNKHFDNSEIFDIRELKWHEFNKIHPDQKAFNVKLTLLPKHKI